jgi:glycerol-3-phosphate cytidylyltransferase-like family protein
LKNVDEVIYYNDVFEKIQASDVDVFVSGEDQINESFQKAIHYCKKNRIKHVIIERTPNISTTQIKNLA